jgi:hypothetical protein
LEIFISKTFCFVTIKKRGTFSNESW